jgi:putative sugar O-methyltransferase
VSLRSLMRKGSGASLYGPRDEQARLDKIAQQDEAKQRRDAEREARRADMRAAKERAAEERDLRKQEAQARRDAERRAQEEFEAQAYENYQQVRAWAMRMRTAAGAAAPPLTGDEHAMLARVAPMWDATPEMIAALRRWCEPVSGVRASDYESRDSDMAKDLKRQIGFLRKQLGPELFVPESPVLGGFGFVDQAALYNQDTVTSFNALVALQDAAVLQAFRHVEPRQVVWEIGGGWGGFAYQFKRVCPNVTYVITGHPDLFLLSAVYLMSVFPEARFRFFDDGADWEGADFVFAPEWAVPTFDLPRLDLTIDLMALQTMTCARATRHVERAFDLGSRYIYTMTRIDAGVSRIAVHDAIARHFWPHPVPPRRDPKLEDMRAATGVEDEAEFSHLVGWKRILLPSQSGQVASWELTRKNLA